MSIANIVHFNRMDVSLDRRFMKLHVTVRYDNNNDNGSSNDDGKTIEMEMTPEEAKIMDPEWYHKSIEPLISQIVSQTGFYPVPLPIMPVERRYPLKCRMCGKGFSAKKHMQNHKYEVHGL